MEQTLSRRTVQIDAVPATMLAGSLDIPEGATGIVLFAHGSGSSRYSPRNQFVAQSLQSAGIATLLIDLLTEDEEVVDEQTALLRFDIGMLAERLVATMDWLAHEEDTRALDLGLFGASTGAGAALVAAAQRPSRVSAVVSRGGRPDLADAALSNVQAPTLLIVGSHDTVVIDLNQQAQRMMRALTRLELVPGATHLFEERGALDTVAALARDWFLEYLGRGDRMPEAADARRQEQK